MKHALHRLAATAALTACLALRLAAQSQPAGAIDFGPLSAPESGGEFVEVNIPQNLISMVARLTEKAEPEVGQLLRGLHSVRVNVVELKDENREDMKKKIASIRSKVEGQGWQRVVTVQDKKEDVGVYLRLRGDEAVEGVVVTVIDGDKEAVLINIVGDIRPEKIALLGEKLNIEPLKKVGKPLEKTSS